MQNTVNNSRYMGVRQVICQLYPSFLPLFRPSAYLIDFNCFPVDCRGNRVGSECAQTDRMGGKTER